MRTVTGPMAAVTYQALPAPLRGQLPSPEAITTAVSAARDRHPDTNPGPA